MEVIKLSRCEALLGSFHLSNFLCVKVLFLLKFCDRQLVVCGPLDGPAPP